jgi:hypothetical protein
MARAEEWGQMTASLSPNSYSKLRLDPARAILVLISKMWPAGEKAVLFGVMLTFTGSILSVVGSIKNRKQLASS